MLGDHARLSPSNHRWVHCPGSIREESVYENISGEAAIDGTGSHLLLELCLKNQVFPNTYLGSIIGVNSFDKPKGWSITEDRVERVQMVLDYLKRRDSELQEEFNPFKMEIISETKTDIGKRFGRSDWWGTVDITINVYNWDSLLIYCEVVDLKDGRGYVSEKDNPQLISYLSGKIDEFGREHIVKARGTIIQPKSQTPVRYIDYTVEQIASRMDSLNESATLTDKENAELVPDDKNGKGYCNWCKHKNNCKALKEKIIGGNETMSFLEETNSQDVMSQSLSDLIKCTTSMSSDRLSKILDVEKTVIELFKNIKTELETRLVNGEVVPGYSREEGNCSKEWTVDEETLVKVLQNRKLKKDQIYPSKLISPAQLLKLDTLTKDQKTKIEKEYIKIVPGKLTLKRVKQVENNAVDMFSDIVLQCNTEATEHVVSFL